MFVMSKKIVAVVVEAVVVVQGYVVLGGDFNASLETRASVAGSGLVQGSQASDLVQERQMVMEILTKHRLAVLNSWGKKFSDAPAPERQLPN